MNFTKAKYYLMPAAICLIGMALLCYYYFLSSFSSKDTTQYLYIDNDDTADSIYVKLTPIGSTHSMTGLRTLIRHCNYEDNIITGRYAIEPNMSITRVFHMLKRGYQTPLNLTIPEVRTMELMAGALSHKLMLDSLTIVDSLRSPDFCQQLGYDTATIACVFIPNTYEVYWNTSLDVLMKRMKKEHDAFWTEERLQKANRKGLTPNEVATLASIVDEETTTNTEKPMVAGMYLNRLRKNMPLQADPTVKFAVGDFSLRRILHKHLLTDSPYNTYRYAGLPPGPIKVASVQGTDAVLNATSHDYLYMCAKEDFSGTHNFARNLQEHLQNARRYQQALNQRGIK